MTRQKPNILLVLSSQEESEEIREGFEQSSAAAQLSTAYTLADARSCLKKNTPDLIFADQQLPDGRALELLAGERDNAPFPLVILAERDDVRSVVEAIKAGALDYCIKSTALLKKLPILAEEKLLELSGVSAHCRSELQLRESEEQYRSFFESAASGMAIIDLEGRPLKVNPTFCRLSGYSEAEALQADVLSVTHPADKEKTTHYYDQIRSGRQQIVNYEKRYLCKDGSVIWGHVTLAGVYDSAGELKCFAVNALDITGKKAAEKRFGTIFDNAAAGMNSISPEGYFIEVNQFFCDFLGYSKNELRSLKVADITHPADLERTAENYRKLGGGLCRSVDYEKRFVRKDGSSVWGLVSVAAVPGDNGLPLYYVGLVQDISEYKHVQEQIRQSKQMLQLVLDYIPQHVFWKDRDSVYLGSNRNFARAAGCNSPEDLIGKTDYELPWKPEESNFFRECDQRVMESDVPELHIIEQQRQADGRQAWLDTNKIPLHGENGEVVGILGTFEDITERKLAEEQLLEANRELDAFVYTVSHDLRKQLTPIISYAESLQESCQWAMDVEALACVAKIESQGRRMMALMEDLLALARVGQVELPAEPVCLSSVVDDVLIGMASQIISADIKIEKQALPRLRLPETLLVQIFSNLINNALCYAGKSGGPIQVGAECDEGLARIYVRDHGQGIPPDERSEIFEVFYRGSTGRAQPGTGVGLATVMKIARLYEGRAWVEETAGGGSTFWVELKTECHSETELQAS